MIRRIRFQILGKLCKISVDNIRFDTSLIYGINREIILTFFFHLGKKLLVLRCRFCLFFAYIFIVCRNLGNCLRILLRCFGNGIRALNGLLHLFLYFAVLLFQRLLSRLILLLGIAVFCDILSLARKIIHHNDIG